VRRFALAENRKNGLWFATMTMRSACHLTIDVQDRIAGQWLTRGGLRATRQRLALARLLVGDGRNRHVTAESLFESAARSGHKVSLATVYNTLRSFTGAGLMTEITVDGTRSYFDTDVSDHAHFYWEDESRLSDAPHGSVRFDRLPEAPEGAEISKIDVVIRLRKA
jgi:Fur family iron response transcriptional regulator